MQASSILKAVPWATLVALLMAIEGQIPEPYNVLVKALVVVINLLAKVSPSSALIMTPPSNRKTDPVDTPTRE